jgi:phosphoserine phosphatase RsbU/P
VPVPPLPSLRRRLALPRGLARGAALWGLVAFGLVALLLFVSSVAVVGTPPSAGILVVSNVGVGLCFGLLGYLVTERLSRHALPPERALWLPLVAGGVGLASAAALVAMTGGPAAIDPERGIPVGFAAAIQVVGLATIEAAVALVLLAALRGLVLFKRSGASVRNWRIQVGLMVAAALVLAGIGPLEEPNSVVLHVILFVAAVLFMVANAFRLSWIVYLPFRQKAWAIALCVALIALLAAFLWNRANAGWMGGAFVLRDGVHGGSALEIPLSAVFSQPLSQFVYLALAFGVLYAATALLALLFHLPTAGALQQKSGEMEALQALARLSGQVFDRERLVETIASAPVEAGVAQAAWLALIEPGSGSLRPRLVAAHGLTPLQVRALTEVEALAEEAIGQGRPVLLDHAPADHRVRARPGDGIGSLLVIPLRAHEEALGALFATRAISEGFERDDVAALETFGAQAALALNSAALFEERIERERLGRELAIAREVQQHLLPQRLPCTDRLACAALSLPAHEVAGDYYDVLDLGEDRVGVIVADVSGKGTRAAFHMAELKGVFQSVGRIADGPRDLLIRANEALADSLYRTAFISALYAVLDEGTGAVTLARAGHCPALLARADGTAELLRAGGLGLGLDRGPVFRQSLRETAVQLGPGDTLVLYTDGLVEARDASGDEFGYERLAESVARHHRLQPEPLRDALMQDLQRFAGRSDAAAEAWEDDLTLVILRWHGPRSVASTNGLRHSTHALPAA